MHLPNGSMIMIERERLLQGQVTALQWGNDALVTIVGHTLVSGDLVVFEGGGIDGYYAKVQRYDTNRVILRGTRLFRRNRATDFTGARAYKITAWTEIPCVQDIQNEGGEQQYYNYQCLSDEREQQLRTFKSAQSITITYAWEHTDAVNELFRRYDDEDSTRMMMMTIPRADEVRYWSGKIAFSGLVTTTVNEMETVTVVCNVKAEQSQMPTTISGVVPVESITVFVDSKIPGQVQIGEFADRRISYFPAMASNPGMVWNMSNDRTARIVPAAEGFAGVEGLSEGMNELYVDAADGYGARGATPFQVIPFIPMTTAVIDGQLAARRMRVGTQSAFILSSVTPANSGEKVQIESTNNGVGRIASRGYDGRSAMIEMVGASTFQAVLTSYSRGGSPVRIANTDWYYGFREIVTLNGLTDINDANWPTTENYRNMIRFEHIGTRRVLQLRKAPETTDFFIFENTGQATVQFVAGANMPITGGGGYTLLPDKSVAFQATAGGTWTIRALN